LYELLRVPKVKRLCVIITTSRKKIKKIFWLLSICIQKLTFTPKVDFLKQKNLKILILKNPVSSFYFRT